MFCQVLLLALIQSATWKRSAAQLTYTIKATWFDDPEYSWTPAPDESRWKTFKDGAENLGLTFAGKAEFPWVVDIRVDKKDLEWWAIGNLVSETTVFTTCRAIDDLGDLRVDNPRVTFAQMYLWEYTLKEVTKNSPSWSLGGSRNIGQAVKHKQCNIQSTYYDGGIITMVNAIKPQPPTINTIILAIDYKHGVLPVIDLEHMAEQRRICYIASIGRDYANIENHLVKDFKVKYRVYYEKPQLCDQFKGKMCPNRHFNEHCDFAAHVNDVGKELICMKSRAKVGAVCDHDRGAPLVCDGQTFGLVILGAKQQFCNDLLPLPFWVQKISMHEEYFVPTLKTKPGMDAGKLFKFRSLGSSADSPLNPSGILRTLSVLFPFIRYY